MKLHWTLFIAVAIGLSSCEKSFLDDEHPNTSLEIYQEVVTDLEHNYIGFYHQKHNWDSLKTSYRKQLNHNSSKEELWIVLTSLFDELDDEHVKLYDEHNTVFVSGDDALEPALERFDLGLVATEYLENPATPNDYILYGKINNTNIGYLFIGALLDEKSEVVLECIRNMNKSTPLTGLIIDVRNCVGGYDLLAAKYAAYFSDGIYHIYNAQFKKGEKKNELTTKQAYYTETVSAEHQFTSPIVLLTNRLTTSEGENFTLNMRAFQNVTHMGDTTAGALSVVGPARFLPNGWRYEYSVQLITNPDGSTYEGVGIPPHETFHNSPGDILNNTDKLLEKAIEKLSIH